MPEKTDQIPALEEVGLDEGRDTEIDRELGQDAVLVPIAELDLPVPFLIVKEATVLQAIHQMAELKVGSALIMDGDEIAGIVTERDFLMKVSEAEGLDSMPITDVMTQTPKTLSMNDMVADAMELMNSGGYRRVPVVDDTGKPVGIFSIRRLIDRLVEYFPEEVLNLPPTPVRSQNSREGA
jgi:CBS domain-containing protein